jgi:hypothetical protein
MFVLVYGPTQEHIDDNRYKILIDYPPVFEDVQLIRKKNSSSKLVQPGKHVSYDVRTRRFKNYNEVFSYFYAFTRLDNEVAPNLEDINYIERQENIMEDSGYFIIPLSYDFIDYLGENNDEVSVPEESIEEDDEDTLLDIESLRRFFYAGLSINTRSS